MASWFTSGNHLSHAGSIELRQYPSLFHSASSIAAANPPHFARLAVACEYSTNESPSGYMMRSFACRLTACTWPVLTKAMELPLDLTYAAIRVASEVVVEPYHQPTRIGLSAQALDTYVGSYSIDDTATRTITRDRDRRFMQRTGTPKSEITGVFARNGPHSNRINPPVQPNEEASCPNVDPSFAWPSWFPCSG
jgi:hypothetical protein